MGIKKKSMATAMALILGLGILSSGMSAAGDSDQYEPTTGATYADAYEPTGGEMFADAVIVRPMTLAASVVGFAAWVVTLPFTIPSGGAADTGKSWVVDPLGYTFNRPLGDISDNR